MTLQCKMRREPISIATKTYRTWNSAVTDTKSRRRRRPEHDFAETCPALVGGPVTGTRWAQILPDGPQRHANAELQEQFICDPFLAQIGFFRAISRISSRRLGAIEVGLASEISISKTSETQVDAT